MGKLLDGMPFACVGRIGEPARRARLPLVIWPIRLAGPGGELVRDPVDGGSGIRFVFESVAAIEDAIPKVPVESRIMVYRRASLDFSNVTRAPGVGI
jgi:hypothetical protein